MAKSREIVANQESSEVEILRESLQSARSELIERTWAYERLEERLSGLDLQLENIGWSEAYGYGDEGPSLSQIKQMSQQIRNLAARNVWVKQGWKLRYNYVYAGGVQYADIPGQGATGRGRRAQAWARMNQAKNRRVFYSADAQEQREGALYADSMVYYIGNDDDYTLSNLPLNQITADYRNPDDPSEVWAYRRAWLSYPNGTGNPVEKAEWIFLNEFEDMRGRTSTIEFNGKREPVAKNRRLFGGSVNRMPGWAYGMPDAFSGIAWARQYREALLNGKTMSDAMASIAFKIISQSRSGAKAAGLKVAETNSAGNVASMLEGQDIASVDTAGRSYDYDASRPLLAAMAAGLGISVVALSGDPGAAGSSYGSAQTLDLPTKLMAESRRRFHIALEKEILEWFGAPDAEVYFEPIEDWTGIHRMMQSYVIKWNMGLWKPEEIKADIEKMFGRFGDVTVPDGVMIPNNEKSVSRSDIDTDGQISPNSGANPGQGQSNGAGDSGTNNDERTDLVS